MKSDIMKVIAIALFGAIIVAVVYVNTPKNIGTKEDEKAEEVNKPESEKPKGESSAPAQSSEKSDEVDKPENQLLKNGIEQERLDSFNEARVSKKRHKHGKERRRVSERAVANLPTEDVARVFENTFVVTGGCEWSKLAHRNECTFLFDAVLTAKSEIEDAKILPDGEIRIEEKRTIDTAKEKLIITDASLKIDLSSSPIDQIDAIAKTVATVSTAVAGALTPIPQASVVFGSIAAGAGALCAGIEIARQFDGQDITSLFGKENVIRLYQAFVDKKVKSIKTLVRSMEGKSYRVIYTQEPTPSKKYMQVVWEHFDGTPLTAEEDFVLSKANIFIDADIMPESDEEPSIGKEWEIPADEIASMFCYEDQVTCSGTVKVSRKANLPNGDWLVEVARNQRVAVRDAESRTSGSVTIKEGDATLTPNSPHQTKTLQLVSSGNIMKFTPQTLLWFLNYDTKRGADCQFKGVLHTYIEGD